MSAPLAVGDVVNVLSACRLPAVEHVIGTGSVQRIVDVNGTPLYWIEGIACARTREVLRLVAREMCPLCEGDGFGAMGGNCVRCGGGGGVDGHP